MSEEIIVDTSEQESAAANANEAASEAREGAAAAAGAAIAQGQLIDIVTEAAREDAARARDQSEAAASEAEAAAELTTITLEAFASEIKGLLEDHERRMGALEEGQRNAPVMIQNDAGATPVNPEEVAEERDESASGTEEKKSSGRKHGRKRR